MRSCCAFQMPTMMNGRALPAAINRAAVAAACHDWRFQVWPASNRFCPSNM